MATAAETRIVKCGACGTQNRVAASAPAAKIPVCGKCGEPLSLADSKADSKPVVVTDANFGPVVGSSEIPVLLDLWAAWCGPCRMIAPVIEELASELSSRVLVGKLDVDANPQTASRFGVQSIPMLLILKDGREIDRLIGLQSKPAILQHLHRFI
jgi:thioredoxin 2